MPKAGIFAPRHEKAFVKGITAYIRGNHQAALAAFEESTARDTSDTHIAEEYFAAFCLVALERNEEAIPLLEKVLASDVELPDNLMRKYGVSGHAEIAVTPLIRAEVPHGTLSAALMLAELLQHTGQPQKAAEVLESLGSIQPDPIFALSLADLYDELKRPEDVVRVSDDFTTNRDDVTAQLLVYRASALHDRQLNDAALATLKEALKSKKRNSEVLKLARYLRATIYEATGKTSRARQELERLYSVDPHFLDVGERLGLHRHAGGG